LNTIATELEQLHNDAIAAVEIFQLAALDFEPTCDFHRAFRGVDVPATHSFTCRGCKVVELRCIGCVAKYTAHPHTLVYCTCLLLGCFHSIVIVKTIGGAA
jgi:hypothetical protein